MTDRRSFIAAALVAPVAMAAPALASAYDPIPEYLIAFHSYDEDDSAAVERHSKACAALHKWEPATAVDMLRKIVVTLDDHGNGPETSLRALIRQADRLLSEKA